MVSVSYYCPHCGTVVSLERDAYLADKSVTPYPLAGWTYATHEQPFEDADGVRLVCGASDGFESDGCGESFYLNFIRFVDGEEVAPVQSSEHVELGLGDGPREPSV